MPDLFSTSTPSSIADIGQPHLLPRHRQVMLFWHLSRDLRRLLHALPWDKLSASDRRRLSRALDLLESDVLLMRILTGDEAVAEQRRQLSPCGSLRLGRLKSSQRRRHSRPDGGDDGV